MNKVASTPPFSGATKLLSFDLEANNLHGTPFAVGAVVMSADGLIIDSFSARCPVVGDIDEWVRDNVLPAIKDMPQTHGSYEAMREAFWRWFVAAQEAADYVLVSNGYPVEYRFLADCQDAELEQRYWQHPFPILDLTSLMLASVRHSDLTKSSIRRSARAEVEFAQHHPLDDAKLAARMAFEALQIS